MSKHKTIDDETLIKLLDEYRLSNAGGPITIPRFGEYVRAKGYNVQDYTIRRSTEFRNYLEQVRKNIEDAIQSDHITYKTLDVDAFLASNHTSERLKRALNEQDRYYANVAANAANAISARKTMEKKVCEMETRIADLEKQLAEVQAKADNTDIKLKNATIIKLKNILESYIYPEAANAILEKEGVLEVVNTIIPDKCMEAKMMHADTDIKAFEYDSVNELLGGFDD